MQKKIIWTILATGFLTSPLYAQNTAPVASGARTDSEERAPVPFPQANTPPAPPPQAPPVIAPPPAVEPTAVSPSHLPPPRADQRTPREISPGILDPNDVWNDPTEQYRPFELDPWRISAEVGGGFVSYSDLGYQISPPQGTASTGKWDDSAGLFSARFELSGRVLRDQSQNWYMVSAVNYEGRSADNVIKIRAGTLMNQNVPANDPLASTEILNRNTLSALTGIRVISRGGELAYRGTLLTGFGSRKWYDDQLLWLSRIDLETAYRISGTMVGPFFRAFGEIGVSSSEIAELYGRGELGIRYASDVVRSFITQFDVFGYLSWGKWNDSNDSVDVKEDTVIFGVGLRYRIWNFQLETRAGYITDYSFEEKFQNFKREAEGSGDLVLSLSLSADF